MVKIEFLLKSSAAAGPHPGYYALIIREMIVY